MKIAVMPGDGVGKEVVAEGLKVLRSRILGKVKRSLLGSWQRTTTIESQLNISPTKAHKSAPCSYTEMPP